MTFLKKYKADLLSLAAWAAVTAALGVWGAFYPTGDEMGYGLVALYGIYPLASLAVSLYAARTNAHLKYLIPVLFAGGILVLPLIAYPGSGLELVMSLWALIPAMFGCIIGSVVKKFKKSC